MFKKVIAGVFAMTLAASTLSVTALAADDKVISNDYVGFFMEDGKQFSMGTVAGDPDNDADDNANLLYKYTSQYATSYGTYVIDGVSKAFCKNNIETVYDDEAKTAVSTFTDGAVTVERKLAIVKSVSTGREDVMQVSYTITNNDEVEHTAGARIMLDTMLGKNDAAPFRVPGVGPVLNETEFEGSDIPAYWQAFNSLSDPYVISQGTFIKSGDIKPDKVQYVDWWHVTMGGNNIWDYAIDSNHAYTDSAITVSWYEKPLAAGESRTYTTYYGLSQLTQNTNNAINLSGYCDSEVSFNDSEEEGAPMFRPLDVTAYLGNLSDTSLANAYASIVLPEGMSLAEGSNQTIDFTEIGADSDVQGLWKVETAQSMPAGDYTITITAGADGVDEATVDLKVTVPEHEMPPVESSEPESSEPESSEPEPSQTEQSSSSKATVNTASTDNPNTGAAAGLLLAAAGLGAVVVTKRTKK